jgi:drug/metabolite transporter (DMT)-like permease
VTVSTASAPPLAERHQAGLIAVVVGQFILGTGSTVVKSAQAPGVLVAFWRVGGAMILWWVLLLIRRHRVTWDKMRRGLILGVLFGVNSACFFTGVRLTRIANAEAIGAMSPIILVLSGIVLHRERLSRRVALAGVAALCGAAMVLLFANHVPGGNSWLGNGLVGASVFSWATYVLVSRPVRRLLSTTELMAYAMLGAWVTTGIVAVVMTALGKLDRGLITGMTPRAWFFTGLAMVLNGMIAHALLAWSQNKVAVSTIGLVQIAVPVIGAACGWLFLDERINLMQSVGIVVVLIAVAVVVVTTGTAQDVAVPASPVADPE